MISSKSPIIFIEKNFELNNNIDIRPKEMVKIWNVITPDIKTERAGEQMKKVLAIVDEMDDIENTSLQNL